LFFVSAGDLVKKTMSLKRAGRSHYRLTDGGAPTETISAAAATVTDELRTVFQQSKEEGATEQMRSPHLELPTRPSAPTATGSSQSGGSAIGAGDPISLATLRSGGLLTTIIPNRLHFASISGHPRSTDEVLYFTTDFHLVYTPYFADFGPLNISAVVRFVRLLKGRLVDPQWQRQEIVYYSGHGAHQRANAACLMACFCVLHLGLTAAETHALFETAYPPLLPFRDASYGISTFNITLLDIVQGLFKAKTLGWIREETFDVERYDAYDALENGDWNWIVPRQIIAFSSPVDGVQFRGVQHVAQAFRNEKVRAIIRLNEVLYDKRGFTSLGIEHHEAQYPDGSVPNDSMVNQCLHIMESAILKEGGAVAIHCKAGLGRTGTMIGIYLMKHYGFTAREAIAWCRLCRPGSMIGPQQSYLETIEHRFRRSTLLGQKITRVGAVATPLPQGVMFTLPHKGGPTGCTKKEVLQNPTLASTQAQLPATSTAAQQHHTALEAHAKLYDHTYMPQRDSVAKFKYASSQSDAIKTSKSSTRKAMYILDGSQKRRTHGEMTGGRSPTDMGKRSSSSMVLQQGSSSRNDSRSDSQLRSTSQLSFLGSTSAEMTAAASSTFYDQTLRKHLVTTSDVANVLPEIVRQPTSHLGANGPGWLRPTEHVPRAATSMW
jgi:protein-tyrosine phosphatase